MNNSCNLLYDAIIPTNGSEGQIVHRTLPETLQALAVGDIIYFCDVKAHQVNAVDYFMAQLAVLAMDRADDGMGLSPGADIWTRRLLSVADEHGWNVFPTHPEIPGFMQPAITVSDLEDALSNPDARRLYPDELTVLTKSKNHTTKFSAMSSPTVWHWIVALIEAQTLSGYDGRGNVGGPRLNTGYGTRVKAALYPDLTASSKWTVDVTRILALMPKIYERFPHFEREGRQIGALWMEPWVPGSGSLRVSDLHPLYIDVNRRYRLLLDQRGNMSAVFASLEEPRVPPLDLHGAFGDPWAPAQTLRSSKGKSDKPIAYQALSPRRLDVRLVNGVLFGAGGYVKSMMQSPVEKNDKGAFFYIGALIRDKVLTNGYEEFIVWVPAKARKKFGTSEEDKLGETSSVMLNQASDAEGILKRAIFKYSQAGKADLKFDKAPVSQGLFSKESRILWGEIKHNFYPILWEVDEKGDLGLWEAWLKGQCLARLRHVFSSSNARTQLSFKAESNAMGVFHGLWKKQFNSEQKEAA